MVRNSSSGIATPTANSDSPSPRLRLEIAGQPGEIAERDKAEDEQDGFGERRHSRRLIGERTVDAQSIATI